MNPVQDGAAGRTITTLSSREVYRNAWMRLREDEILRSNGQRGIYGVVEKDEAADPLNAFPGIEMRNDEAQGAAMLGGERLAVMVESEENIGLHQIFERYICGVALFREN